MGATKITTTNLEIVKSYKPVILESQFKEIANSIVKELVEFYLHYGCREFRFNCENGIRIDIEARYDDEDGGSIKLETIEISDNQENVYTDEEEAIGYEIDELLESYNREQEFNYDAQRMTKKELYAEYNL